MKMKTQKFVGTLVLYINNAAIAEAVCLIINNDVNQ